ncbi:hypothetical protein MWN41_09845 [Ornithobacterium rhinotracheale]|uniref:hypothetical protein n=1 Tax=Ornithobacterium rhinotracheale TaxID=28251 RepID=UPI001FF48ACF|nr:hypothetical protein [Ornithobacterium rhinotracheale]MCK0203312.1 hypothetical protein [Ornithobacterium rhinotracheale]
MVNDSEKKIAQKASKDLQYRLRQGVKSFKSHSDGNRKRLKDLEVKPRLKRLKDEKGTIYFLNALTIKMEKHGFIQHHGANTIRHAHGVERKIPRFVRYIREAHTYNLPRHEFIDSAIKNSGVVPYLAKELSEIRGYQVLNNLMEKMAENVNHKK